MSNNIGEPKTIEDYFNNVKFQCDSVEGYLSVNNNFSAAIKVECLIEAAYKLLEKIKEEDEETANRRPIFILKDKK